MLALAIGAFSVLHKDVQEVVTFRISQLGFDTNNHYIRKLIELLGVATPKKVEFFGAGSFFYAALFAVEGVGLLLQKRWAELFTVLATASFLPLEIYEFVQHSSKFKLAIIIVNVAVVLYLILRLRKPLL